MTPYDLMPEPIVEQKYRELFPYMDFKFRFDLAEDEMRVFYRDTSEIAWEETDDEEMVWAGYVLFHYGDTIIDKQTFQSAVSVCAKLGHIPHTFEELTNLIKEYN